MTTHSSQVTWKAGGGFGKKAELYLWQCIVVLD